MLHINMTVVRLSEQSVLACLQGFRVLWLGRSEEGHEELRCVLAVVRHGDRTPKQKMKMKITQVCIPRHAVASPVILDNGKERR